MRASAFTTLLLSAGLSAFTFGACKSSFDDACSPGELECACLGGDTCAAGLMCVEGTCHPVGDESGTDSAAESETSSESGGQDSTSATDTTDATSGDGDGDATSSAGDESSTSETGGTPCGSNDDCEPPRSAQPAPWSASTRTTPPTTSSSSADHQLRLRLLR